MNEYKIEFSYMRDGRRIYKADIAYSAHAEYAVDEIRREYSDLDRLQIERVWIDRGRAWEIFEFDY